jgi:hypothetical protein
MSRSDSYSPIGEERPKSEKLVTVGAEIAEKSSLFTHAKEISAYVIAAGISATAWAQVHPAVSACVMGATACVGGGLWLHRRQNRLMAAQKSEIEQRLDKAGKLIGELKHQNYLPFHTQLLALVKNKMDGGVISDADIKKIWTEYFKVLHETCKTATSVHALLRPDVDEFDFNVKLFAWDPDKQEFCFSVVARASQDPDRLEEDLHSQEDPIPVLDHFVYHELIDKDFRGDAFACRDIEELIRKFEEKKEIHHPNPHTTPKRYKSMVVHLINGQAGSIMGKGLVMKCRKTEVVGVICADSPVVGAFGAGPLAVQSSQLTYMRKLASMIFASSQLMSLISDDGLAYLARPASKRAQRQR